MGRKQNTTRKDEVVDLSKNFNNAEIASILGITRERVRQILEERGITGRRISSRMNEIVPYLGKIQDTKIASVYGISTSQVQKIRAGKGIPRYEMPTRCGMCETHEYAKGMCRNCYARNWRRTYRASKK